MVEQSTETIPTLKEFEDRVKQLHSQSGYDVADCRCAVINHPTATLGQLVKLVKDVTEQRKVKKNKLKTTMWRQTALSFPCEN